MTTTPKPIVTREEFSRIQRDAATVMAGDRDLLKAARDLLARGDGHRWLHQNTWMGEPVLNLPQDMFALQDIIWRTRPEFIIEVGVAWGGGMLFHSTLLEVLGGGKVIGVDIFIPPDLRARLASHARLSRRIELFEGSSVAPETVDRVRSIIGDSRRTLVVLDSHHTHDHVLAELRAYAPLVGRGCYLVAGDTIVEHIPAPADRPRPWGPGNNPATAVSAFLRECPRFAVDRELEDRLLLSCHPGGYLVAAGDP